MSGPDRTPAEGVALIEHRVEADRILAGGPPPPAPIAPETRRRIDEHKLALMDPANGQEALDELHDRFGDYVDTLPEDEAGAGHQAINEFIAAVVAQTDPLLRRGSPRHGRHRGRR